MMSLRSIIVLFLLVLNIYFVSMSPSYAFTVVPAIAEMAYHVVVTIAMIFVMSIDVALYLYEVVGEYAVAVLVAAFPHPVIRVPGVDVIYFIVSLFMRCFHFPMIYLDVFFIFGRSFIQATYVFSYVDVPLDLSMLRTLVGHASNDLYVTIGFIITIFIIIIVLFTCVAGCANHL